MVERRRRRRKKGPRITGKPCGGRGQFASLVKGRWPSEARPEGLPCRRLPLLASRFFKLQLVVNGFRCHGYFFETAVSREAIPPSRPAAVPPPFNKGGKEVAATIRPPCERGRKRRSGDCLEISSRSRKWHFKIEEPLRHVASLERQSAVRQSLRHGLRPCHLPLTREAERLPP